MRRFLLAAVGVAVALVFVLGIIPNLVQTWQKNRVKRTSNMQTISQALEDYAAEHHVYPAAHSMEELKARLVRKDGTPLPIRDRWDRPDALSMRDPWGRAYVMDVSQQNYSIRCLGSDGKPDRDPPKGGLLDTEKPDRDTIIVDGLALQHPWNYGGGGSAGGSAVSLGRGGDAGTIIIDGAVQLIRNGRVLVTLPEGPARFQGPAGEYQLRGRVSEHEYLDAGTVVIESGKVLHKNLALPHAYVPDRWTPNPRQAATEKQEGLEFVMGAKQSRYACPSFVLQGGGVHLIQGSDSCEVVFLFQVPPGQYELSALLSGRTARIGTFKAEGGRWSARDFSVSWGDVHLSVDGPIAIHEASVNGWSAVARQGDKVIARTELFPDVFFLLPGYYTIDLVNEGQVRSSKRVAVTAGSEQWIALQE